MTVIADLHTHTNVSHHAFSTLEENCRAAAEKKLYAIAMTNHAPALCDGAFIWHFGAMKMLPRRINGVYVLRGAEVNILENGEIDIDVDRLKKLDYVIASFHEGCVEPGKSPEYYTSLLENILKNPYVNTFGHLGNASYAFDYEAIISKCNQYHKIVEINNHSFTIRKGSCENCRTIALLCKKYRVPVVITSDAHISFDIGASERSIELLSDIDFPEELIINTDLDRLRSYFLETKALDIFE